MTLPYDYANCEGCMATSADAFGTTSIGRVERVRCQRRTSPPSPYRQSYILPPQFIDGRCPMRIGEGEK